MPFHLPQTVAKHLVLACLNSVYRANQSLARLNYGNNTYGRFILTTHLKQFLDTKFGPVKLRALKTQTTKDQERN